ncbi:MAG: 16S rRNA (cytosine(1402)-N(4))-methyltransferase RsmH [Phycisphaeraceae bacterium]
MTALGHLPVLPAQVLDVLAPRPGDTMLDCTVGRAGHALLIAPLLAPAGRYIGLDVDPANLAYARQRLAEAPCQIDLIHANFATAPSVLAGLGVARVDLLLADLGFSSTQMDDPSRGLSFTTDAPLDMRLDPTLPTSAADLVNALPQLELANLIYRYGEERLSRRIARNIVEERRQSPILTTARLAQLVRRAYGPAGYRQRIDPATRTFMALRIAVNAELEALTSLLEQLPGLLAPGGRAAIISFHSLEDRLVKHAFAELAQQDVAQRLTRKPVTADEQEIAGNPRSRSAKMRAIRMVDNPAPPRPTGDATPD